MPYVDRDGDVWYRGGDGRWRVRGASVTVSGVQFLATVERMWGPLTPIDDSRDFKPEDARRVRAERIAARVLRSSNWIDEDDAQAFDIATAAALAALEEAEE